MFSEREERIIQIIGNKSLTIEDISTKLFKDGNAPFDASITVSNSINRIIKKCEHYEKTWTLKKNRTEGKMYIFKAFTWNQ